MSHHILGLSTSAPLHDRDGQSFQITRGASPWAWHDLLVVALWGVGTTLVSLRRFRWAPRRSSDCDRLDSREWTPHV